MVPVAADTEVKYLVCRMNFRKAWAPFCLSQALLIAHCQDPPPTFGPLPRFGGGRKATSLPSLAWSLIASQLPSYNSAVLPLRKSSFGLVPDFCAMYPFLTRPLNQLAHCTALSPLRTFLAV